MIRFTVEGEPQPKGSMRMVRLRGKAAGKTVVTSDNPQLKAWERDVAWAATVAMHRHALLAPPVGLKVEFRMPATLASQRTARVRLRHDTLQARQDARQRTIAHVVRPDIDKLLRGVCDPLSGVCYEDDKQVAEVLARKRYCREDERPGVSIELRTLTD